MSHGFEHILPHNQDMVIWHIGCHDAREYREIIDKRPNWHFHLFEPQREIYDKLQEEIGLLDNVSVYPQAVVTTRDHSVTFYRAANDSRPWASRFSSLKKEHIESFDAQPFGVEVPAIRYNTIHVLTQSLPNAIVIDAEGMDFDLFGLISYVPRMFKIETHFMSDEERQFCASQLKELGYIIWHESDWDQTWVRS